VGLAPRSNRRSSPRNNPRKDEAPEDAAPGPRGKGDRVVMTAPSERGRKTTRTRDSVPQSILDRKRSAK